MPNLEELRRALAAVTAEAAELRRADVKGPTWAAAYARARDRQWRLHCAFVELRDAP
jgi:hypothetical protein